jgi:hypothetical protein
MDTINSGPGPGIEPDDGQPRFTLPLARFDCGGREYSIAGPEDDPGPDSPLYLTVPDEGDAVLSISEYRYRDGELTQPWTLVEGDGIPIEHAVAITDTVRAFAAALFDGAPLDPAKGLHCNPSLGMTVECACAPGGHVIRFEESGPRWEPPRCAA